MEYSLIVEYGSWVLFVMACLVFGVNIIVEVVKKLFPKVPTTFVATILSVAVTMAAFLPGRPSSSLPFCGTMWRQPLC